MANHRQRIIKSEGGLKELLDFFDRNWQGIAIILGIVALVVWYQALGLGTIFDLRKAVSQVSTGIKETAQQLAPKAPEAPIQKEEGAPVVPQSFAVKAVRGQGITHLARKAFDDYLVSAKPQATLSREHKIYIEDYLKDQAGKVRIHPGTELSFSKDSIEKAIELSQKLSPKQLANLTKYANRVPSLQAYQPVGT